MNDAFKRLLAFARRTGDKLIITDAEGQESFVLLSLDQYEALLGGSEAAKPLPPPERAAPPPARKLAVVDAPAAVSEVPMPAPSAQSPAPDAPTQEFGEEQFYLEPVE